MRNEGGPERIGAVVKVYADDLAPTDKQLRYLKALAYKHGSSFVVPVTRQQAAGEITRLLGERKARAGRRKRRKH